MASVSSRSFQGVGGVSFLAFGKKPVSKGKRPRSGGLFLFLSIYSGYQVERIKLPNILGGFGVEVVWNQGSLLRFLGLGLDNFSGFRGFEGPESFLGSNHTFGGGVGSGRVPPNRADRYSS